MARKWVLIVDDDPAMLVMIEDALAYPDLNITTASDALQSFIQARDLKPIVIISDIQMPGYGYGTTTLTRLREDNIGSIKSAETINMFDTGVTKPASQAPLKHHYWALTVG